MFSVAWNTYRNEWITVHNEWEGMWQEAMAASFKSLLRHSPSQNDENTKIASRLPVARPLLKLVTSGTKVRSTEQATTAVNCVLVAAQ
jgi:hypothetical protein